MSAGLKQISCDDLPALLRDPVDAETLSAAAKIVMDVRARGEVAVREYAVNFKEISKKGRLVYGREDFEEAFESLPERDQALLGRIADRIQRFAEAQRNCLTELTLSIPGGIAGHTVAPVEVAGCYAPGGGFPLPSSLLMTAVTARAAGVERVVAASPKPAPITLAAAYVAKVDALLAAGGSHAIAALAYGSLPGFASDVVVGPGSKWVTAAKQLVSGRVGIDMLAGPSELVVLADETAEAKIVAADLLAQAEHGYDSLPVLVTTCEALIKETNEEIARQLETLPTRETAEASIGGGYAVLAPTLKDALSCVDRIAPEHLEILTVNPDQVAARVKHYGGVFIGAGAAEVLGDYGAGPNHTLPTGGTARFTGGLSVFDFLRVRTWMRLDSRKAGRQIIEDSRDLARHELLEAHARAAELRLPEED